MGGKRYTEEFKREAVGQILERGYSVQDVSKRIGVSSHSLYKWLKADPRNPKSQAAEAVSQDQASEIAKLKAELARVKEEREILKKGAAFFANQSE